MSIRLFSNDFAPKYVSGKWIWDEKKERIRFEANKYDESLEYLPKNASWIKFKNSMSQAEEVLFVKRFWRKPSTKDSDVIVLQDVKNLVLFLARGDVDRRFVKFFHTPIVDEFLNDLIIYFEYYFKFLEYLLSKRKHGETVESKLGDKGAVATAVALSEYMDQYRIILSREYCQILMGADGAQPFHHMANPLKTSYKDVDMNQMELFASFSVQVAWIAMHRRNFDAIDFEINRLFRSNHFNPVRWKGLKLTSYEQRLLYGKSFNDISSQLHQNSPLAIELMKIDPKNIKYMWLGQLKYNGTSKRMIELELEFLTPDAHLILANVSHGILGHPRKFYDTMLQLNRDAVRRENFTPDYDPYQLVGQPFIVIPDPITAATEIDPPPTFAFKKKEDKDEVDRNIALWESKEKAFKSINFNKPPKPESTIDAANKFVKMKVGEVQIDHAAIVDKYLRSRKRP